MFGCMAAAIFVYLLFTEMTPFMISHVSFGAEALTAILRASEWPLILVYPQMYVQVLLLAECLVAVREGAFEWLCAIVQVHMGIQSNLATENLLTTVMRANKCLFTDTLHFKC